MRIWEAHHALPCPVLATLLPTKRDASGHLLGANLTSPPEVETRDLLAPASSGAGPAWARRSWARFFLLLLLPAARQSSAPQPGFSQVPARGNPPLCPSPLSAASARPRPEAAPLRPPPGPRNSQMGRYHPHATQGRVRRRRALEVPAEGRVTRDSRQGTKEGGGSRGTPRTERPAAPTPNTPHRRT